MLLKKTIGAILLSAMTLIGAEFKDGVNYETLKTPLNVEKGTVVKVWSYDCPFCYKYDKAVTEKVMKAIPNVKFETWHLSTKAKYGKQGSNLMAVAKVRDDKAKIDIFDKNSTLKKIKMAYYKAYHDKKQRWDAGEDKFYAEGLKILNISKSDLEKEAATKEVQTVLNRWNPSLSIAKIQGVPGFVVDGKYILLTKAIKSRDYMIEVIKYLQNK